jgi:hypothetical protein
VIEEFGVGSGGRIHAIMVNEGLNWSRIAQKVVFGAIWTLIAHALHTHGCPDPCFANAAAAAQPIPFDAPVIEWILSSLPFI